MNASPARRERDLASGGCKPPGSSGRLRSRLAKVVLRLASLLLISCAGRAPYEGRSVAELERMLRDSDSAVQVQGAYGLSLLGAEARAAVPTLAEALRSKNALV